MKIFEDGLRPLVRTGLIEHGVCVGKLRYSQSHLCLIMPSLSSGNLLFAGEVVIKA